MYTLLNYLHAVRVFQGKQTQSIKPKHKKKKSKYIQIIFTTLDLSVNNVKIKKIRNI